MIAKPIRVLFVSDGSAGAQAVDAALRCDPLLTVVATLPGANAETQMAGVQVVVAHGRGHPDAQRAALIAAAEIHGAALLVVNADDGLPETLAGIRARVKATAAAAGAPRPRAPEPAAPSGAATAGLTPPRGLRLIAIGASTGGVEALVSVLAQFPANTPPTVVVQHMPETFTASFAGRLNGLCAAQVEEAWDGAPLDTGRIYIAPGGPAHLEVQWSPQRRVRLVETAPVNRHRPSVDVAFDSIVRAGVPGVAAALLTGMGRDGARGLRAIRDAGGRTVAQDQKTSTVYGMPKAALELGAVDAGTPLDAIAKAIFSADATIKETL
jgi:two-component system chemotaxis response regulator CheB